MRSLRGRLFLTTALAIMVTIVLTLLAGTILVRRSIERSILSEMGRQADLIALRQARLPLDEDSLKALRGLLGGQHVRPAVVPRPLPDQPALDLLPIPDEIRTAVDSGQPAEGKVRIAGRPILYVVRPAGDYAVVLSRPAGLVGSDWRPYLASLIVAGLVGAGLAALTSFVLARRIAGPIGRVAAASRSLAAGQAPGPVPVESSDELGTLAVSFNQMAAELARARATEQAFLLSVSHELKTPLTAIRGYAEALGDGAVHGPEAAEVIAGESERLERLVQDLLDLARLNQRSFSVRREPIELATLVLEAVRRYQPRAASFGVKLSADAAAPAPANGDAGRVLQILSNLVENAIRATPAGGTVTVSARPGEVRVADTGPGLAPEDIPRAFERFFLYRRYGGEREVGTGLGLAIVKELSEAMGGSVTVGTGPAGGTVFAVRLG